MKQKYLLVALLLAGATITACTNTKTSDKESSTATPSVTDTATDTATDTSTPVKTLPEPFTEDDNGNFNYANSNVTAANFNEYAERQDVLYVDLRNASDYTPSHLRGFEMVEFFATIYDQSADHSGKQLFYKDTTSNLFVPRYEESVETLDSLLPNGETIFLMCQSGGRVSTCMQLMAQFGWDMSKVYNIGGMNHYADSKYRVDNVNVSLEADSNFTVATTEELGTASTEYTKLVDELPYPADEGKRETFSVSDSNIDSTNFDDYAERSDVLYIDLRNASDFTPTHLRGFEMIEFFANIYDQSADHSGKQLFYKNADGKYVARYEESVDTLKVLFPQDKTIFLMCQSGGRVVTCMQILAQFGWDMGHVYNIGGMGQYSASKYRVDNVNVNNVDLTPATVKVGTNVSSAFGAEYTTKVVLVVTDEKISQIYVTGECSDSSTWPSNAGWYNSKESFLKTFIGKTAAQVSACIDNDGKVVSGSDAVTGATLSTTRVYNAVINALTAE